MAAAPSTPKSVTGCASDSTPGWPVPAVPDPAERPLSAGHRQGGRGEPAPVDRVVSLSPNCGGRRRGRPRETPQETRVEQRLALRRSSPGSGHFGNTGSTPAGRGQRLPEDGMLSIRVFEQARQTPTEDPNAGQHRRDHFRAPGEYAPGGRVDAMRRLLRGR